MTTDVTLKKPLAQSFGKSHAHLMIAFLALLASANYLPLKFSLQELQPINVIAWRFLVGAIVVACYLPRAAFDLSKREFLHGAIVGSLFIAAGVFALFSLQTTKSGITAFLIGTCALFVPIAEYFMLRRLPTIAQVIGLIVAMFGLILIAFRNDLSFDIGSFYGLCSAVLFGIWAAAFSYFGTLTRPKQLGLAQIFGATLIAIAFNLAFGTFTIPREPTTLASLLYLGVVSVAFRFMAQSWAQAKTTATNVEIIFLIEPCGALLWGYLFVAEIPTQLQLLGCAIIVVGIICAQLKDWKHKK